SREFRGQLGDSSRIPPVVACHSGNRFGTRVRHAAGNEVHAWHRRVRDDPGLLQDFRTPFARTSPGLREWLPTGSLVLWASGRYLGGRSPNSKIRLAISIHRNWADQLGMASRLDEVDATRQTDSAVRSSNPQSR